MSAPSFAPGLAKALGRLLEPLRDALAPLGANPPSTAGLAELLGQLGWTLGPADPAAAAATATSFAGLARDVEEAVQAVEGLAAGAGAAQVAAALAQLEPVLSDIAALAGGAAGLPAPLDRSEFWSGPDSFPAELWPYLLQHYLRRHAAPLFGGLRLLGVLTQEPRPAVPAGGGSPPRAAYVKPGIQWQRLADAVSAPGGVPGAVYGWGGPSGTFDHSGLIAALRDLLRSVPLAAGASAPSGAIVKHYYNRSNPARHDLRQLVAALPPAVAGGRAAAASAKVALVALPVPPPDQPAAAPVGLVLFPLVTGRADQQVTLAPGVDLALHGQLQLAPVLVEVRPAARGLDVRLGKLTRDVFGSASLDAAATVSARAAVPWVLVGGPDASRVELAEAHARLDVHGTPADPELRLEAGADRAALVVDFDEADGFLRTFVGGRRRLDLACRIEWSSRTGFAFDGQGRLAATLPVHLTLAGAVRVDSVHAAVRPAGAGLTLQLALTGGLRLGPVAAAIDRVGVRLDLKTGRAGQGNLGDIDLAFGFKPPDGLGLAVDADAVAGGGYVAFDPDKGEYAGTAELKLDLPVEAVQVEAVAVVDTRRPGGAPGFTFLMILTAQFDPGLQLGFGFSLNGVGGLAGINRRMALGALRSAVRTHALDDILFPPDPVANAPRIVSEAASVFPENPGSYVFGPMLELDWGTPAIVTAELGVLFEVSAPFRMAILGLFAAGLPTLAEPELALVLLHIDIAGSLDTGRKLLAIDGSLYDSHAVEYALSGEMAMRLTWGDRPEFALAVGGLNPRFQPPPGFPHLRRLMIGLSAGSASLSLGAYFAVTSNSVQCGADVELHARAAGFTVHGYMGFDALFVLSPFSFAAGMRAGVEVLRGGHEVLGLDLELTLTGPRPWQAHGAARFHVLCFTVHFSVDVTVGDAAPPPPLPQLAVMPRLLAALAAPASWNATLPDGSERLVSLAPRPAGDASLRVHPLGRLTVQQKVVPLGLPITRFGAAAPADFRRFAIGAVSLGGTPVDAAPVRDFFARGQFQVLSDGEKLSKPSYELFDAGVRVGAAGAAAGAGCGLQLAYDTYYVEDPDLPARRGPNQYLLPAGTLAALTRQAAPALAPARGRGAARYTLPGARSPIATDAMGYVIAGVDDLVARTDLLPGAASEALVEARLQEHLAAHPGDTGRLQVVPVCEAVTA